MKENFADEVVEEVKGRLVLVRKELHNDFSRKKPFRKEKIDPYEEYMQYRILNQHPQKLEVLTELITMYGEGAVNTWFHDMYKFETDKRRKLA